nr:dna ligase 4 [Quercus suber]
MARYDVEMRDADAVEEDHMMYGHGAMTEHELDQKYPNRPHNHSKTLPFHDLYLTLFNPLNDNKRKPTGPPLNRKRQGPNHGIQTPHEIRRSIIERFISRWRKEVGDDIYPALRLIVPEKDRDRGMYGLKEMTLGKMLVKIMKINKDSEDGYNLLHWKLPGMKASSSMAGDFAGRCYEVISKRPMLTKPGDMSIAQVNELLDRLSVAQKEENQFPIMEQFYNRMNAEELMWLIRVILRQMKVGATERTIFEIWHPDADGLYNISSSLRRVCWELYDTNIRLDGDDRKVAVMQCFQPQLAAFQMRTIEVMVSRMGVTEEDPVFWIEEKLDGERMQLHMIEDDSVPGGKRFEFWSRKAKNYTYLYGNGYRDENGSLTRHIEPAFNPGVRNIILDGEMITWDPKEDAMVPFGHLKTAALAERDNPYANGMRPLFRVFDCLFLNDRELTHYTLRDRRKALAASISSIWRRIEVHEYKEASRAEEVDPYLRQIVAEASEGLVLKNPRSEYRLNERNDDWIKVKPEYMTEFGEALDCVVIGGYYGSGKRGGNLSSFLCGLRVDQHHIDQGANPMKCFSFFKVGGGFAASDYAEIRHCTDGKWIDWDFKNPPREFIELGGGDRQYEKPDVWIKPCDSIVVEAKAASVTITDQFRVNLTLRFPRFKKLRTDKDWKSALSLSEFMALKGQVEDEHDKAQFKVDDERRKGRTQKRRRRVLVIQGQEDDDVKTPYAGPSTKVFQNMTFLILTDAMKPLKKSKAELEQIVKSNGGKIVASEKDPSTVVIAERNLVKVASIKKRDERNLIRPSWILDCVRQSELDQGRAPLLLPFEPQHLFYTIEIETSNYDTNVDEFGDSYTRDVTTEDLLQLFRTMPAKYEEQINVEEIHDQLIDYEHDLDPIPGWMFRGLTVYFEAVDGEVLRLFAFAGGNVASSPSDPAVTHIVVQYSVVNVRKIRQQTAKSSRPPRIVTEQWVTDSWLEKTLLDAERKFSRK